MSDSEIKIRIDRVTDAANDMAKIVNGMGMAEGFTALSIVAYEMAQQAGVSKEAFMRGMSGAWDVRAAKSLNN